MGVATGLNVAQSWTNDELRGQLTLTLDEHKKIPADDRHDYNDEFRRVMDWYKVVCEEFRRRDMKEELEYRVYEYRTGKKPTR